MKCGQIFVRLVIYCINLTYVPTTAVVAVVVDGFIISKFWFPPPVCPLGSHGWYRPWVSGGHTKFVLFATQVKLHKTGNFIA